MVSTTARPALALLMLAFVAATAVAWPPSTCQAGLVQWCGAFKGDVFNCTSCSNVHWNRLQALFWARAGGQNAPCDHMRAHPARFGTYMDIQRSAGCTSCPTTRVGGLARGTLGALANNWAGWLAGWKSHIKSAARRIQPASSQIAWLVRFAASQPAATPHTPPTSRWRPCATPPRGGASGVGGSPHGLD